MKRCEEPTDRENELNRFVAIYSDKEIGVIANGF